jgi:IMP and pyridine-specific 5'-nucleotidase
MLPRPRSILNLNDGALVQSAPSDFPRRNIVGKPDRDELYDWIKKMLNHSFVLNMPETYATTWETFEQLVEQHRSSKPGTSPLQQCVPTVGTFHTPLPAKAAWLAYDAKYCASKRRYVTPTFNEIRHILNLAQVMAVADSLELISFDGDQTLYSDGSNFSDNDLAMLLINFLRAGIRVVVMTAAGYGYSGEKYEHRLEGLLKHFRSSLTPEEMARFYVLGGECNYLMACNELAHLVRVPDEMLLPLPSTKPILWDKTEIGRVLDIAEATINTAVDELRLRAKVIRKERSVGLIPGGDVGLQKHPLGHGSIKLKFEALDEVAMRVQEELGNADPPVTLPFCAFNGGRDAWIDVGNKGIGMELMQALLKVPASKSLHVGDQFLKTGNDIAARSVSPCIWIVSPAETRKILEHVCKFRGIVSSPKSSRSPSRHEPDNSVYTGFGLGNK